MPQKLFSIDFYNDNITLRDGDFLHLFSSVEKFLAMTKFPFQSTVKILSYEPERRIAIIERPGGVTVSGTELEEFQWVETNFATIVAAAHVDFSDTAPPQPTVRDIRNSKLYETDWLVTRHHEQKLADIPTTLTEEQFKKVTVYRQELRDMFPNGAIPNIVVWPELDL